MKHTRLFLYIAVAMVCGLVWSQDAMAQRFGYLSYGKVLRNMPEYTTAQNALKKMRDQYNEECKTNESHFYTLYSEYIAGQKKFPEDIMLKRQKELQLAMESSLDFRKYGEQQLRQAETELMAPIEQKLDSCIAIVAKNRVYSYVLNTDGHAYPYINKEDGTDITSLVELVLSGKPLPQEEGPKVLPGESITTTTVTTTPSDGSAPTVVETIVRSSDKTTQPTEQK